MATVQEIQSEINQVQSEIVRVSSELRLARSEGDVNGVQELERLLVSLSQRERQLQQDLTQLRQNNSGWAATQVQTSDDGATQNPSAAPVLIVPEGRINQAVDVETGTNVDTRTLADTQSVPAEGFDGSPLPVSEGRPTPGGAPGAGAGNDDTGTRKITERIINTTFNSGIKPQPNVLDQYASYTYSISWYLMSPESYKTLLTSQKKSIAGFQLLMQSGGAPTAGRNPEFPVDYYIDNLELTSYMQGKGTGSAHNLTDIRFTVTEPNGITLLGNLYRAVDGFYKKNASQLVGKTPGDYAAAEYCLVIRFYGYDDEGKLIQVGKDKNSSTEPRAVVEKFYPFHLVDIQFRVASKLVEYQVQARPIAYDIGFGSDRAVIPYNTELSGTTLKDILVGKPAGTNTTAAGPGERPSAPSSGSAPIPTYDGLDI